jgi:hypothetical protein
MYRAPPEERRLARCEAHGLSYDPRTASGCTVCIREGRGRTNAGAAVGGFVVAFSIIGAIGAGVWFYTRAKRAPVGQECEAKWGCVDGADCLTRATPVGLPGSDGKCFQRCDADTQCTTDKQCVAPNKTGTKYCMVTRKLGEACDYDAVCARGLDCIDFAGKGPKCLQPCSYPNYACEADMTCTSGPLAPVDEGYCVPASMLPK